MALKDQLGDKLLLAQIDNSNNTDAKKKVEDFIENDHDRERKKQNSSDSGHFSVLNFSHSSGSGGGDGTAIIALVVFAIIGTVILVAWVPYFPTFAYAAATGKKDYSYISMITFNGLGLSGIYEANKESEKERRVGEMYGARYSFLLRKKKVEHFFQNTVGISVESGYYHFTDESSVTDNKATYYGMYAMAGPSIIFSSGKLDDVFGFWKLDMMAGKSLNSDLDLALRGDITGNIVIDGTGFWGLGVGALYLDGKKSEGIIRHMNDLAVYAVGQFGFFF